VLAVPRSMARSLENQPRTGSISISATPYLVLEGKQVLNITIRLWRTQLLDWGFLFILCWQKPGDLDRAYLSKGETSLANFSDLNGN
jgi:hypothetical protein